MVQSALPISLVQAEGRGGREMAVARESILGSSCPEEDTVRLMSLLFVTARWLITCGFLLLMSAGSLITSVLLILGGV